MMELVNEFKREKLLNRLLITFGDNNVDLE